MKQTFGNNLLITTILVAAFVGWDVQNASNVHLEVKASEPTPTIAPVASPTPSTALFTVPTDIVGYITYKFGDYAPQALKIVECESKFKSTAFNDNTQWGGIGQDRGYWQINNVFHPHVSDACAKDVKCSTDYAFRMWTNDRQSFKRWTCSRIIK